MTRDRNKLALKLLDTYDARLDDDCKMSAEQLAFYAKQLAHLDQAVLTKALDQTYAQYGRRKLPTVNEIMVEYRDVLQVFIDEEKRQEADKGGFYDAQHYPEMVRALRELFELTSEAPNITRDEYNARHKQISEKHGLTHPGPLYTHHLEMTIRAARARRLPI